MSQSKQAEWKFAEGLAGRFSGGRLPDDDDVGGIASWRSFDSAVV
jgi:hypothetical protein